MNWRAVMRAEAVFDLPHANADHDALRRDLAIRALSWQQLYDPLLPDIFLACIASGPEVRSIG